RGNSRRAVSRREGKQREALGISAGGRRRPPPFEGGLSSRTDLDNSSRRSARARRAHGTKARSPCSIQAREGSSSEVGTPDRLRAARYVPSTAEAMITPPQLP